MQLVPVLVFLLVLLTKSSSVPERTFGKIPKTEKDVQDSWINTYNNLRKHVSLIFRILKPVLNNFIRQPNITRECTESTEKFLSALQNGKAWAFKILDSWGKLPSGLLTGVLTDFGSYYECQESAEDVKRIFREDGSALSPRYCILDYRPSLPLTDYKTSSYDIVPDFLNLTEKDTVIQLIANLSHVFRQQTIRVGSCVPSSCSANDAQRFYQLVFQHIGIGGTLEISHCDSDLPIKLDVTQKIVIYFISTIIFMLVIGTVWDVALQRTKNNYHDNSILKQICLSFSVYSNAKKLFHINKSSQMLSSLHGIRVISLLWIIVCHSYLYVDLQSIASVHAFKEFFRKYGFQFVVNGTFSVDTFFFLSGLLVSYSTIKLVQKYKSGLNIPAFIAYRLFRIYPTYMLIMGCVFLIPLLGHGPVWNLTLKPEVERCRKNWWTNFLYINNFVHTDEGCLDHSWYLAADTQLYISSLVVLIPLCRWPSVGLTINFLFMFATMAVTAALNILLKLPPTALTAKYPNSRDRLEDWVEVYYKPYPHAGAYCVGIGIGYLIAKKSTLKLTQWVLVFGWLFTIAASAIVLFAARDWNLGKKPFPWVSALYASLSRTVWSLCVAWVTLTCVYGYGGIIEKFLSCRIFIPLSRVCYATYLIHPLVQWIYNAQRRERIYPSHYIWTYMVIGHITISFSCAFICSIAAESPFLAIQKLVFGRPKDANNSGESNSSQECIRKSIDDGINVNSLSKEYDNRICKL